MRAALYARVTTVDPGFRAAVEQFLNEERRAIANEIEWLRRALPYRASNPASA